MTSPENFNRFTSTEQTAGYLTFVGSSMLAYYFNGMEYHVPLQPYESRISIAKSTEVTYHLIIKDGSHNQVLQNPVTDQLASNQLGHLKQTIAEIKSSEPKEPSLATQVIGEGFAPVISLTFLAIAASSLLRKRAHKRRTEALATI